MISAEQQSKLIEAAQHGVQNAYTKMSSQDDFRIGCAVLTSEGNIYSSGQYFSYTQSLTLHAEQGALVVAASHGEYDIVAIAVTGNTTAFESSDSKPIYPCHMCKQILYESNLRSKLDMEVIIANDKSEIVDKFNLSSVISKPWPL